MAPGSRQGTLRSNKITLAAKVAAPQDELDQLTHRNRMDWLGNRRHAGSFMPQPACGNRIVGDDAPALLKKAWSGRQNSVESSVMTETPQRLPLALRSIAIFEAAKGALALAAGCGLLSLRHTDLHAVADAFLLHHGIDPETHYRRLFIESVGINPTAARFVGINAKNIIFWIYAFSGLCAGVAGLVVCSTVMSADGNNAGLGYEMSAILAVVLGGTSLNGGKFYLLGSMVGALIVQTLTTTIYAFGVPPEIAKVVIALVVLVVSLLQSLKFRSMIAGVFGKREFSA